MNRATRTFALLGALGAVCLQGSAIAAPVKAACKLLQDPAGDTHAPVPDGSDERLDITSADVAVSRDHVVVVLRLKRLPAADPAATTGQTYEFDFSAKERNFIFAGSLLTGGSSFSVLISDSRIEEGKSGARSATGIGPAEGFLDSARREMRMVADRKIFEPYVALAPGARLHHLAAFTYRASGMATPAGDSGGPAQVAGSGGIGVDEAWGRSATYRVGKPSCVRP